MDIILDANAYLGVLVNNGGTFLQTNQFVELLTYLRRTNSRLVIPLLTYSEVVERYRDKLNAATAGAREAWTKLGNIRITGRSAFPEPSINHELRELRKLLRQPASGMKSAIYGDYADISIAEVVRRGIKRIRPSSDQGEELRDVVLWLVVLKYATQMGQQIAFVSDDKAFRDEEGTLHPNLQEDIARANAHVAFYRSVGAFVKGNALESEPLLQDALLAYVTEAELRQIPKEQLVQSRIRAGAILDADITHFALSEARRYRVADDSYYIEAQWTGEAGLKVSETQYVTIQTQAGSVLPSANLTLRGHGTTVIDNVLVRQAVGGGFFGTATALNPPGLWAPPLIPQTIETAYTCKFDLRVSLRVVGTARQSLEMDKFAARDVVRAEAASA